MWQRGGDHHTHAEMPTPTHRQVKGELQEGLKKSQIGPQTRALIMHDIDYFATDTDYNISEDYDGLTQAVCLDQHTLGWKHFLQGKLLPDWMDIINTEQEKLGLPHSLRAVPQMMTSLVTITLNLWRTRCEFLHGRSHNKKVIKQRRILLQHFEDLKSRSHKLGRKGRDHIAGAPTETAQFRVIRSWIRTAQTLYQQATRRKKRFSTYHITTYFRRLLPNG
jgi:hypothetical protein